MGKGWGNIMVKLLKHTKKRWYYFLFIIIFLSVQAMCDLTIPSYTAKMVNIGIQQKGIEDGVPEIIRKSSLEGLLEIMGTEKKEQVKRAYQLEGDQYSLTPISEERREVLNQYFMRAIMAYELLNSDNMKQIQDDIGIGETATIETGLRQIPKELREEVVDSINSSVDEIPEAILLQNAVDYISREYTSLGGNINKLQSDYMYRTGLKMLGVALLGMAAAIIVTFFSSKLAAYMGKNVRYQLYSKVLAFSGNELSKFSTATLITRSTNDVQQVQLLMTMLFRIILYAPVMGIGGIIKVIQTEPKMTWIPAVGIAAIIGVMGVLFLTVGRSQKYLQKLIDRLNLITREFLTGLPVIRAFTREKYEENRFDTCNKQLTKTSIFVSECMALLMPIIMLILNGVTILIVYKSAYYVSDAKMQVGSMMAFIEYSILSITAFLMVAMMSTMIPRASVSAKRINEILDTEILVKDSCEKQIIETEAAGTVRFEHVSFGYLGANENVLNDINFTAFPGQTIAIIGSTGSGKSTLIKLLLRFYDVSEGRITIDGVDINYYTLEQLRNKIGYVPQKSILFSGTIESNIRFGNENATDYEIQQTVVDSQVKSFIESKKDKYQAIISQGGDNVSGGQKQRLSIARAIVKHPEIYIFDDSFSALDYQTELALRKALNKHSKKATKFIVAQRISTIINADLILVLDGGKIVGKGNHDELLRNCNVYQQIAKSQLSEEAMVHGASKK